MAVLSRPSVEVTLHCLDRTDPIPRRTFVLSPDTSMPVGRSSKNPQKSIMAAPTNTYIDSPVVSRCHAVFTLDEDSSGEPAVYITDRGSMHGTKINNDGLGEVDRPYRLRNGDVLAFGGEVQRDADRFTPKSYKFTSLPLNQDNLFPLGVSAPSDISEDEYLDHDESGSSCFDETSAARDPDPSPPVVNRQDNPRSRPDPIPLVPVRQVLNELFKEDIRRREEQRQPSSLTGGPLPASYIRRLPDPFGEGIDDEADDSGHSSPSHHGEEDSLDGYDSEASDEIDYPSSDADDISDLDDPVPDAEEQPMPMPEAARDETCCDPHWGEDGSVEDNEEHGMLDGVQRQHRRVIESFNDPEDGPEVDGPEGDDPGKDKIRHDGGANSNEPRTEQDVERDSIRRHKLANMLSHHEQQFFEPPKNYFSSNATAPTTAAPTNTYTAADIPPYSMALGPNPPASRHEVPSHHWSAGSNVAPKLPMPHWEMGYDHFMWQHPPFPTKPLESRMYNPTMPPFLDSPMEMTPDIPYFGPIPPHVAAPSTPPMVALANAACKSPSPPPHLSRDGAPIVFPPQLPRKKNLSIKEILEHEPETSDDPAAPAVPLAVDSASAPPLTNESLAIPSPLTESPRPSLKRKADVLDEADEGDVPAATDEATKTHVQIVAHVDGETAAMEAGSAVERNNASTVQNDALPSGVTKTLRDHLLEAQNAPQNAAPRPRKRIRRAFGVAGTVGVSMFVGALAMVGGLTALPDTFFQ